MSEVHEVIVTVRRGSGNDEDPGQITTGYYTLDGNLLTMTRPDGEPVKMLDGEGLYRHTLQPGEDARAIAVGLTKKVRSALSGEKVPGFNRQIFYPPSRLA